MRRIEATALVSVGTAVIVFGLFFYMNPFRVSYTDTVNINALSEWIQSSGRQTGERVEGYLTVTGGDEEIWFTIEDPNGVAIEYVGIRSRIEFAFTAEYDGMYIFRIYNAQQDSEKTVFLAEQRIAGALTREFWFLVIGAGAFSLALGLLYFFSGKKLWDKKTEGQTIPPPP